MTPPRPSVRDPGVRGVIRSAVLLAAVLIAYGFWGAAGAGAVLAGWLMLTGVSAARRRWKRHPRWTRADQAYLHRRGLRLPDDERKETR